MLADYQRRFRYILVDEYQDTNVAQYLWLRLLAQGRRNICCVGDDDQSIYGWRGAEVDNILRFEKDFPGADGRSAWSATTAPPATSWPPPPASSPTTRAGSARRCSPTTSRARRSPSPARGTARRRPAPSARRSRRCSASGHTLDEIAILVRASFQMRDFEDRFITLGLPYRVIGGPRFYERAEIRDALAYLPLRRAARPTTSPSSASSTCPSAASATPRSKLMHDHARAGRHAADAGGARAWSRPTS